jgi:hypothetical protein
MNCSSVPTKRMRAGMCSSRDPAREANASNLRGPPTCSADTHPDFLKRKSMTMTKPLGSIFDLRGRIPESWACIDCGINTAPGCMNRAQLERAFAADWNNQGVKQRIHERSEVYTVKPAIWEAAGIEGMGGCLCIGCLEKRLGRTLIPRDFLRNDPFNSMPGTDRLLSRRSKTQTDGNCIE